MGQYVLKFVGVCHITALCLITLYTIRRLRLSIPATISAGMIVLWSNLVFTGQFLSLFSALNNVTLFVTLSLALSSGVWVAGYCLAPSRLPVFEGSASPTRRPAIETPLLVFFAVTLGAALVGNLMIATTHLASNPDTIVYRFPRVYWYLSQASFAHFSGGTDPRLVYYPTNGVMLYLPLVMYRFGALWFNLPTLLMWCVIPATAYAFARNLGAERLWAAAAAWAIALTPNVLVQATATNDEILAAGAMLGGLFFLHRWFRGANLLDFALGASGVCLSVGTKLHIFFFWPYLLLLLLVLLLNHSKTTFSAIKPLMQPRGLTVLAYCIVAGLAMVASFIIYNLRATGQITDIVFARQVLNTPWSLAVSAQTIVLYAAQIILSPFPDLSPTAGYGGDRAPHYVAFNAIWAPFFNWVDNSAAFMSVGYRFTGITGPVAFYLNEESVKLGYSWLILGIAIVWLISHRGAVHAWAFWIAISFPSWFICWAGSTKYIEGIAVYLAYGAIVSSPSWAFALAPIRSAFWSRMRWVTLLSVAITHVLTAYTIFTLNTSRSVPAATASLHGPPRSSAFIVDPSVTDELKLARSGVTQHTIAWGQPNWIFMVFNPEVPQFLQNNTIQFSGQSDPDPTERSLAFNRELRMPHVGDRTLHVYPIRQFPSFGYAAIRIRNKSTPGLTHIGNLLFALGPEWVFAVGNDVEKRHPNDSNYIVLSFNEVSDYGHNPRPILEIQPLLLGIGKEDDLDFRYRLKIDGNIIDETKWSKTFTAKLKTDGLTATNGVLTVQVLNNANGEVDSVEVKLRSVVPPPLPQ